MWAAEWKYSWDEFTSATASKFKMAAEGQGSQHRKPSKRKLPSMEELISKGKEFWGIGRKKPRKKPSMSSLQILLLGYKATKEPILVGYRRNGNRPLMKALKLLSSVVVTSQKMQTVVHFRYPRVVK